MGECRREEDAGGPAHRADEAEVISLLRMGRLGVRTDDRQAPVVMDRASSPARPSRSRRSWPLGGPS